MELKGRTQIDFTGQFSRSCGRLLVLFYDTAQFGQFGDRIGACFYRLLQRWFFSYLVNLAILFSEWFTKSDHMLSIKQVVIDCGPLFRLLIKGKYLNKGKSAHYLHHIFLVVDCGVVFGSLNVGSKMLARVVAKFLTCRLIVLCCWAFYDFMTNCEWLRQNLLINFALRLLIFVARNCQNLLLRLLWWNIVLFAFLYISLLLSICLHFAIIILSSSRSASFGRIFVSRFQFQNYFPNMNGFGQQLNTLGL